MLFLFYKILIKIKKMNHKNLFILGILILILQKKKSDDQICLNQIYYNIYTLKIFNQNKIK